MNTNVNHHEHNLVGNILTVAADAALSLTSSAQVDDDDDDDRASQKSGSEGAGGGTWFGISAPPLPSLMVAMVKKQRSFFSFGAFKMDEGQSIIFFVLTWNIFASIYSCCGIMYDLVTIFRYLSSHCCGRGWFVGAVSVSRLRNVPLVASLSPVVHLRPFLCIVLIAILLLLIVIVIIVIIVISSIVVVVWRPRRNGSRERSHCQGTLPCLDQSAYRCLCAGQ
jgi:hypothetical protein